jgi:signal transduction histidine kinase
VENIRSLAAQKEVVIELTSTRRTGKIDADPMRVGQVATNLVGNAISSRPTRAGSSLSPPVSGEDHRLVKDYGRGISARDITRLFQRFAQLDSSTTTQGQGAPGLAS